VAAKRGSTGLSAIIAVDKPSGCTSHDVVNRIRRITGERRVGHAGTLDPMATGLLIVCIGPAARLSDYIMGKTKAYEGTIAFGIRTDTDDATGEVVETGPAGAELLDAGAAADRVASLVGTFMQMPPQYSAKKRDGRKAYELARKGEEAVLDPVEITVGAARLLAVEERAGIAGDDRPLPCWDVELEVSKGTYIRSIARDMGADAGTCATLAALRRTRVGDISVADAIDLDQFEASYAPEMLEFACIDPVAAIGLPALEADESMMRDVSNGRMIDVGRPFAGPVAIVCGGRLHAVYEPRGQRLACKAMIPGGVMGARS
jgi:tRNA pseudouridine55 synthase